MLIRSRHLQRLCGRYGANGGMILQKVESFILIKRIRKICIACFKRWTT